MIDGLALYRWFNQEHELLYIGISSRIGSRVKSHSKTAGWFLESAYMTVEWAKSVEELNQKERIAIRRERPIYNVSHNQKPERKPFSTPVSRREIILLARLEILEAKEAENKAQLELAELEVRQATALKELFETQTQRAKLIYDEAKIERLFTVCNH